VVGREVSKVGEKEQPPPAAPDEERGSVDPRSYVPRDILDVSFPVSVRGYDRRAVDAYIKRVNRVIAEIKVGASPPAAVRHALDQAGEKVESLLQAAREAAEEITTSARQEAEESTARAKAEAAELILSTSAEADRIKAEADEFRASASAEADGTVAKAKAEADEILARATAEAHDNLARTQAEADERLRRLQEELAAQREQAEKRMRDIQADTEQLWKERRELLDDVRTMASGLVDLANAAAARVQGDEPAGAKEELAEPRAGDNGEPSAVATDESAPPITAVESEKGRDDEPQGDEPGRTHSDT
jgi:DivIVA domain-containing protein